MIYANFLEIIHKEYFKIEKDEDWDIRLIYNEILQKKKFEGLKCVMTSFHKESLKLEDTFEFKHGTWQGMKITS